MPSSTLPLMPGETVMSVKGVSETGVQGLIRSATGSDKRLILGRDADGNWVVCDERGLVGGLFADRGSAVHFALFESEFAPAAVVHSRGYRPQSSVCFR